MGWCCSQHHTGTPFIQFEFRMLLILTQNYCVPWETYYDYDILARVLTHHVSSSTKI